MGGKAGHDPTEFGPVRKPLKKRQRTVEHAEKVAILPFLRLMRPGPEFLAGLRALKANNTREWYAAHKAQFERDVRAPWTAFVEELIASTSALEPELQGVAAAACTFRIARDTRFSKDKRPFTTWMSANLAPGGRKDPTPGMYVQAEADGFVVGGGAYSVSAEDLAQLREAILDQQSTWKALCAAPEFRDTFGGLLGDAHKRVPAGLLAGHPDTRAEDVPYLLNKQFYYFAQFPAETVHRPDAVEFVVQVLQKAEPMRRFLRDALRAG